MKIIYKSRNKPMNLSILEILNHRMKLTNDLQQHYLNLKKGYEGELLFDSFIGKVQHKHLVFNDLLLEVNNTTFQIDSLLIMKDRICIYEVKNYEGDYYYESGKFYKKPSFELINPLEQLNRSESLLRQLLTSFSHQIQIDAYLMFVNPKFTLYQAPLNQPIIYPTQIQSHMEQLHSASFRITTNHKKIAQLLLKHHMPYSHHQKKLTYNYQQLRKGLLCTKCQSFSFIIGEGKFSCKTCSNEETLENSILKNIQDFTILFPNEKITTDIIHDWCSGVRSKKQIRRLLLKNLIRKGNGRWTYFE